MKGQLTIDDCIQVAETGSDGHLPYNFDRMFVDLRGYQGFDLKLVVERAGRAAMTAFDYDLLALAGDVDVWKIHYAQVDRDLA